MLTSSNDRRSTGHPSLATQAAMPVRSNLVIVGKDDGFYKNF